MLIGQVVGMIGDPHLDIVYLWMVIWFHEKQETSRGVSVYCKG
jgi:hypothetical protein